MKHTEEKIYKGIKRLSGAYQVPNTGKVINQDTTDNRVANLIRVKEAQHRKFIQRVREARLKKKLGYDYLITYTYDYELDSRLDYVLSKD